MKGKNSRICPAGIAWSLDNSVRRFFQNPQGILRPYILKGMTVLDLGCGPGFFSIEIAGMLNGAGKVIAADIQEGMLDRVRKKIEGTELEQRLEIYKCESDRIGITEKVDFILAFWMIHEVPDQDKLFRELKSILKPRGEIYIAEPVFHVSERSFNEMLNIIRNTGFEIKDRPKMFFSRAVLLTNKKF
jgi:ubiquinone/menaquinone biosynthesis C-methylase UbiE